jgi:hypothetical protein
MNLAARIKSWWRGADQPLHLRQGDLGEWAAKQPRKGNPQTAAWLPSVDGIV